MLLPYFSLAALVFLSTLVSNTFAMPLSARNNDIGPKGRYMAENPMAGKQQALEKRGLSVSPTEVILPRNAAGRLTKVADSLEKAAKISHRAAKTSKKLGSNKHLALISPKPAKAGKKAQKALNMTGNVLHRASRILRTAANFVSKGRGGGRKAEVKNPKFGGQNSQAGEWDGDEEQY